MPTFAPTKELMFLPRKAKMQHGLFDIRFNDVHNQQWLEKGCCIDNPKEKNMRAVSSQ